MTSQIREVSRPLVMPPEKRDGMTQATTTDLVQPSNERRVTAAEFQDLAAVPAAAEWFANLDNPRTRRAYQGDLADFCSFVGLTGADEFRTVTRAYVLAWRAQLEHAG